MSNENKTKPKQQFAGTSGVSLAVVKLIQDNQAGKVKTTRLGYGAN